MQTIESQDLSLGKLFDDFFVVPSYQREYVWEDKQVEQLLDDVHTEFTSADGADAEYFIGSLVTRRTPDGAYELIDGQQRVTTAFLVLCSIRDYLRVIDPNFQLPALESQISANGIDREGNNVFRYRVTLQYDDSAGLLEKIGHGMDVDRITARTRSTENVLNAYQQIRTFLEGEFGRDRAAVQRFYAYFTLQVKLIRVNTTSVAHALKVFETINDRGTGLDSMDLLKNLLFMQASQSEFEALKTRWKKLVDTLHEAEEKPLRFLRYYIFARFPVDRLKEEEIYDWFSNNAELAGYERAPIRFVDDLVEAAQAFVHFAKGKNTDGSLNPYLQNIGYLSWAARQHLIVLLASRHFDANEFLTLCRELENLLFVWLISREPTKELERLFARWTEELRRIQHPDQLEEFIESRIVPTKRKLVARFDLALRQLHEGSIQKYRMRYVLAKLTQYVDDEALGGGAAGRQLKHYLDGQKHVEHILPQTPVAGMPEEFGGGEAYYSLVRRLGNLVLLEQPINASISNQDFETKKHAYCRSTFFLTRSLGEPIQVGVNTRIDRVGRELLEFKCWTPDAIDRRQDMLRRLAYRVWDVPAEPGPVHAERSPLAGDPDIEAERYPDT